MEGRRQGPAVAAVYRQRLAERSAVADRLERRHAALAWTRLAVFAAGVGLFLVGGAAAPWAVAAGLAFLPLLFVHARVLNARDRARRAAAFYERGLARLEDRWHGTGERGDRFRDPPHLYAEDLDLFGPGSLFDLLATTRTRDGERLLAQWLLAPAAPPAIVARQQAVQELSPRLDLQEEIAVVGPELRAAVRTDELAAWAMEPARLTARWPPLVLPVLGVWQAANLITWLAPLLVDAAGAVPDPPALMVPLALVQLSIFAVYRHRVHHVAHAVEEREQELEVLATLMARLEREPVQSPLLVSLRDRLRASGRPPADEVKRLARLVSTISSGHNLFFAPISAVLMLGTQLAFAVERWRLRSGPAVCEWLQAVAEYEALAALATYTAEHPDDPFPEVVTGAPVFDAEALAHPLLPRAVAVANDVRLGAAAPPLWLVSGSNMSGKSTLLRTVGLNAVLAQAGAPVRARRLRMTPLAIGATLRIQDSLQEGRSRFYAEITRISAIVALARSQPVLFLLDELLSGTNSHDRLHGATGILTGLVRLGAIGLATTHDLALTHIVDEGNMHFDDRFEHDTLTFDYRVKPGVVQSSNAIALMRAVGLDV